MSDHAWGGIVRRLRESRPLAGQSARRGSRRPQFDRLEARELLVASLQPIANLTVPQYLGYQLAVDGAGASAPQTFQAVSDNPNIRATAAQGNFLTLYITHTADPSAPNDVAFAGPVTFQLFQDLTPDTVAHIEELVNRGFYVNKNFHRIANGFPGPTDYIVQGGSVNGNGTGDVDLPGFPFADEFNTQLAFTGTYQLAMANAGNDTNQSQLFVTTGSPRGLDFRHTILGELVEGKEIIDQMTRVARGTGSNATTPLSPILISNATLSATNTDGVIHIDATRAVAGETANVTVTSFEAASNTTSTRSFRVGVVASDPSINERPFLQPVANQTVGRDQPAVFQLTGVDADPLDNLSYIVQGAIVQSASSSQPLFTPVQNATASVDSATGIVTVTPNPGFSGTINLVVGVRDDVNRGGSLVDSPLNYDTQTLTVTVNADATPVNLRPIAIPVRQSLDASTPTTIQLAGRDPNASSRGLTYQIVSGPNHGTIRSFDPTTGRVDYTPNTNFTGPDVIQYTVTQGGDPASALVSVPSTATLNVQNVSTGAVRQVANVLIVTPRPRTDGGTNTIEVGKRVDATGLGQDRIVVTVNGVVDALQPVESDLLRVVVFGSKANDVITVDEGVLVPATLDGGHGGRNRLKAGGGPTTLHGWFGRNRLIGGPDQDALIGRAGRVRFVAGREDAPIFSGTTSGRKSNGLPTPPQGTFYKVVRGRLVPRKTYG